jgi:hypothetical protein
MVIYLNLKISLGKISYLKLAVALKTVALAAALLPDPKFAAARLSL